MAPKGCEYCQSEGMDFCVECGEAICSNCITRNPVTGDFLFVHWKCMSSEQKKQMGY